MNIFMLDKDVTKAAQAHCDTHVSKMVTELAQMLSTAHHLLDQDGPQAAIQTHAQESSVCRVGA